MPVKAASLSNPSVRTARAVLAATERHHGPDDPRTADARREVRRLGLREHIQRVVDEAPPLTAEQRSELAALLLVPGGAP